MNGSFIELIKDIKRDDSMQNVERNYDLCVRSLKEMDRSKRAKENESIFSLLNPRTKDKSITLLKLLYLQMYGRKIDPEHNFAVIEMLTSDKYVLKRRGHLFLHHSTDRDDVTFLSINLFRKELYKENFPTASSNAKTNVINSLTNIGCAIMRDNIALLQTSAKSYSIMSTTPSNGSASSPWGHFPMTGETPREQEKKKQFAHTNCIIKETNIYNTALVLNTLSNVCTSIMSSNLHDHVLHLLNSSQVYIKKKTIISLYKIVICNLDTLPVFLDTIKKSFLSLYNNESASYDKVGKDEMDRAQRDNTTLCCLIVNILAEVFCALEGSHANVNGANVSEANPGSSHSVEAPHGADAPNELSKRKDDTPHRGISTCNQSQAGPTANRGGVYTYLKKFLAFIPLIYSLLNERLSLIDNWKFIKIVKFLKKLVRYENRIYRKFLHLIVHVFFTSKAKSVIFECLRFLLFNYQKGCVVDLDLQRYAPSGESNLARNTHRTIQRSADGICDEVSDGRPPLPPPDSMEQLLQLCFTYLANSFHDEDKNIVYVTTKTYLSIFATPDLYQKFVQHSMVEGLSTNVLSSLYHDVTIRKSLLRIVYYLMDENNFESIAYNILTYLYHRAEGDFVGEYVDAILLYGQKKAHLLPNRNLYVFILFYMLCIKNHKKESKVIQEILRVNGTQGGTTHITTNFLSAMYVVTYGAAVMRRELGGRSGDGGVDSRVDSRVASPVASPVDNRMHTRVGKNSSRLASPFAATKGGDHPRRGTQQESHESELLNHMSIFLKEVKTMDAFSRYDILEYIIGTLKIHGSDDTHDKEEDLYKDPTQVEVSTFEYLIYFLYAYLEEAHDQIKEYKNEHFLRVLFFCLYLFFTHFSVSSILWHVGKIFLFFYQYEENRSLVLFYVGKFSSHMGYVLRRRNSVEIIDCCVILRNVFFLLRDAKHAEGLPPKEDSPTGEDTNLGIDFYSCVTDYLQLDPSEEKFHLDRPFKYDDAFFLPKEGSRSRGSPSRGSGSREKLPRAVQRSSTSKIRTTSVRTPSMTTPSEITASALTVDEVDIPRACNGNGEPTSHGEATSHGDLRAFLRELKEEQTKWRQRDKRTFHQISQTAHIKLYFQLNQDERFLRLYVQLVGSPVTVKKLSIRTSLLVKTCQVEFNAEEDELVLLGDDKMAQGTTISDDLTTKKHHHGGSSLEKNPTEKVGSTTLTELTTVEEVTSNFLISVHFEVPSGSVKLAFSYLCDSILHEESSVEIPFVPLEPVPLSMDELTNVKKKRGMNRIVTEEIKVDPEIHPNELIFSCCVILAEYLHFFFFNMGKVFSNLRSGCCVDSLRLIFCSARTSSRETPPDKTIFLINVHYRKTSQAADPPTYRVEAKMKVLNDSEEECVRILDYVQFYLSKLLTGRDKIKSPRIAVTRG
ncbi:hypothetical protein C922_02941 [Plasmodium inui San Antonio 1]|uniref:Clathrin/coatomer adaptor adaptin-like N-terminal domain-containing protein n=1 Tax=Plasmodium inui San Antonio 1 TaxID=1237626 RepID=W7A4I2_9APIC|nr:hypothetical protein C922_02941 [Plasmodium inui San Antonio 1]EUD66620.1 hypothetical protein C922_02941 [Plasmodium inui San Antonio 1]